jgi:hypothetical protein
LLRALGVVEERIPPDVESAAGLYRTLVAGRRLLVLLDNARDAAQVRPLLPGAGTVLITSRDALGGLVAREGASRLAVDVLADGAALAVLAATVGAGAVRAEPDAARELVRRCAGLPMALRLAAAGVPGGGPRPLGERAAELRERAPLDALAVEGDRELAVRAAFDASYHRLDEPARRTFRLLAAAPGAHVTTATAAAVTGDPPERAAAALRRLAAAHLLVAAGRDRYRCHDLLRQYAAERAGATDGPTSWSQRWTGCARTTAGTSARRPGCCTRRCRCCRTPTPRPGSSPTTSARRRGWTTSATTSSPPSATWPNTGRATSPGGSRTACVGTSACGWTAPTGRRWRPPPSPQHRPEVSRGRSRPPCWAWPTCTADKAGTPWRPSTRCGPSGPPAGAPGPRGRRRR